MEYGLAKGETADPGEEFEVALPTSSHRDVGVCAPLKHSSQPERPMGQKLATIGARIGSFDSRRVKAPAKVARGIYHTPEYAAWREAVIARAGRRCEAVDNGKRCWKAERHGHRMFADHKTELSDGGAPFDPDNGACLCGSHHTAKTAAARADRR